MKALVYLMLTQAKNRILSLKRKPGLLILYIFLAAIIIGSAVIVIIFGSGSSKTSFADERILFLILSGIGLLYLYSFILSGLSTGSSLFTMPDVGLLFVAPISSKKILMYGLLSTMGKSMLGSLFIFYQIGNLKNSFNYGFREIFALFTIFAILLLFCQLLAIGIYIFTNGSNSRKNVVKGLLYSLFGILLLSYLIIQKQEQTALFETLMRIVVSEGFGYFPVAGWTVMLFIGVVQISVFKIIMALALFVIMGVIILILLTAGKADYYEDVLLSTETVYHIKSAAKEGRSIPQAGRKKIKVKDNTMGLGKGRGAMAIFYRHMLEHKRKSRLIFIDSYSVFMMVGAGVAGYNFLIKAAPDAVYYGVLSIAVYFQYFTTVMGKLRQELSKPYIYLIPDSSLNKVFAASITSLLKPCVDGICIFAVLAVTSRHNILECAFFALAYAASGAVFTGMTILYQRVLGGQPNLLAKAFIGLGLLVLVMGPAIGASVIAAFLLPDWLSFLFTLPYSFVCILFSVLLFVLCGNLIDKSEYSGSASK